MSRKETTHIIIHCSATKPSMDVGAQWIDREHRARGFLRIGYHKVIRRDGTVEDGRALDERGAHCLDAGMNHISVGICLIGGVSEKPQKHIPGNPWNGSDAENNFTPEQFKVLREMLFDLLKVYPGAQIIGHRDVPGVTKACPSFDVKEWWALMPEDPRASE